jgi:hypothetical protein
MSEYSVAIHKLNGGKQRSPRKIPLPLAGEVLYAHPNEDGEEKKCGNCYKWVAGENVCLEVEGTLKEYQNCGYHVPGRPRDRWMDLGQDMVPQDLAGVEDRPTSCGTCRHSFLDNTRCEAVRRPDDRPAIIEPLGRCVLWRNG